MALEVVGTGMIARAFGPRTEGLPAAIVCAAGVADSGCVDPAQFERERTLLHELIDRAAANGACLVYFSGAPVYGPSSAMHVETDRLDPVTPYGRHKRDCEELIRSAGARHLLLRLPNVVGSVGNPRQLVPSLIGQVAGGQVTVRSGATRDLIGVEDVVRIVRALIARGVSDAVVNVASGISTPVGVLATQIAQVLGASPRFEVIDGGDVQAFSTAALHDLLPDDPGFDEDYPATVLRRHVPSIHRAMRQDAST